MATEIDPKLVTKLAGLVKKEPGNSERFYSEKSNIPMGQILRYLVLAELEADPSLKIPATGPSISKARDEQGLRWPRIAARAGVSEAKAKELYEGKMGAGSASSSYSGRGRKTHATSGTSGRRASSKTKTASAKSGAGASGRRGATKKTSAAKTGAAGTKGRRGTRASAADPK